MLRSVLDRVGADEAAHTRLRTELDTAAGLPTLAAEYQTIAAAAPGGNWDAVLLGAGLTVAQADAVRRSPARGPLIAALRDADARGLNVASGLPRLVHERELGTATDIASVLRGRVQRWIVATAPGPASEQRFIAGLIPAARDVTDPDRARALADRADAMTTRAHELAAHAARDHAPWLRSLGIPPADPARRTAWLREVAVVAAYRDRWTTTDPTPIPVDAGNIERDGHARRAAAAARRARQIADAPTAANATPPLEPDSGHDI